MHWFRRRSRVVDVAVVFSAFLASCTVPSSPTPRSESPPAFARRWDEHKPIDMSAFGVSEAHADATSGRPTFLWLHRAASDARHLPPGATPGDVAWSTLGHVRDRYGLGVPSLASLRLAALHRGTDGTSIARFEQVLDGMEVFQSRMAILLQADLEPVAVTGTLSPLAGSPKTSLVATTFRSSDAERRAVERALEALVPGATAGGLSLLGHDDASYTLYALPSQAHRQHQATARLKPVWFPSTKRLVPSHYVELTLPARADRPETAWSFVVSSEDGRILFRKNLLAHEAYTYRVYAESSGAHYPYDSPQGFSPTPHPTGILGFPEPAVVASQRVTLEHGPLSTNDPWLPAGATSLVGNNVRAYADLASPDGYKDPSLPGPADAGTPDGTAPDADAPDADVPDADVPDADAPDAGPSDGGQSDDASTLPPGDMEVNATGVREFDYAYDTAAPPNASAINIKAGVTNLFYVLNFLHDWFYDAGWNETSANPQKSNYGRGGVEGDPILAESQDYSGRNNANAFTPADGRSPRIQMYVFDGPNETSVQWGGAPNFPSPTTVREALFGPTNYHVQADAALAADGTDPFGDVCQDLTNGPDLVGKIALIDRGGCTFTEKVKRAQNAGALGVLIAHNEATGLPGMGGADATITIPAIGISQADGAALRGKLVAGTAISVSLDRVSLQDRDGSLDGMIVAHEWGHILSNRLVGNGSGLSNNMGNSMGEGWSDFVALLMAVRPEDAALDANLRFRGTYAVASYAIPGPTGLYFGLRRVPYSVDTTKNGLTFKHVADGNALPTNVATSFGQDGSNNAEVHNAGEVWATMLWECYVALLQDTGRLTFAQAQQRMKDYLVASLMLTPSAPTFLEARDALLAAAAAKDRRDFALFAQAFARRGAGTGAADPPRDSTTHAGVVESFVLGSELAVTNVSLEEGADSCDGDGVVDNGEKGVLRFRVQNTGAYAVGAAQAFVSSTSADLSYPKGAQIPVPVLPPFAFVDLAVEVALTHAPPLQRIDFDVSVTDPGLLRPGAVRGSTSAWTNFDKALAHATKDTFELAPTPWTAAGDGTLAAKKSWDYRPSEGTGTWFIPDQGGNSDQWLISPPLDVAPSADLKFTLRHRYAFEADTTGNPTTDTYWDGGVIEISTDGGATWTDLGKAVAGYNATIAKGSSTEESTNPLRERPAFGGMSPSYPEFVTTTFSLGSNYQGQKNLRLRFRVGTDEAVGAPGWEIDEIAFEGITNTPFASRVPHAGLCTNKAPSVTVGVGQRVAERSVATLTAQATDPDGDATTITWTQTSGPPVILSSAQGASVTFPTPEVTQDTTLVFTSKASDGTLESSPAAMQVIVYNVNRPPVASAGSHQEAIEGSEVTLDGSGSSDPDLDPLSYSWTQVGGSPVSLQHVNSAMPTFQAPNNARGMTLWFSLTVTDGLATSLPATVGITITEATSPDASCPQGSGGSGGSSCSGDDKDAGDPDASTSSDAAVIDSSLPDGSLPDASLPDASKDAATTTVDADASSSAPSPTAPDPSGSVTTPAAPTPSATASATPPAEAPPSTSAGSSCAVGSGPLPGPSRNVASTAAIVLLGLVNRRRRRSDQGSKP